MKDFLPLGSVVLLKGTDRRIMVVGRVQIDEENKYHDYSGVLYPEGFQSSDKMYIFDQEAIQRVYSLGYQDAEEDYLRGYLAEELAKRGIE